MRAKVEHPFLCLLAMPRCDREWPRTRSGASGAGQSVDGQPLGGLTGGVVRPNPTGERPQSRPKPQRPQWEQNQKAEHSPKTGQRTGCFPKTAQLNTARGGLVQSIPRSPRAVGGNGMTLRIPSASTIRGVSCLARWEEAPPFQQWQLVLVVYPAWPGAPCAFWPVPGIGRRRRTGHVLLLNRRLP